MDQESAARKAATALALNSKQYWANIAKAFKENPFGCILILFLPLAKYSARFI
jgi:hypothetical protein